jgi:hypothetical protein
MRKAICSITVLLALFTTGCALSAKNAKSAAATPAVVRPAPAPAVPPAPAPPLSIPQTQVDLPHPQPPVDPNALSLETPPQTETEILPATRPSTSRGHPAPANPPVPRSDAPTAAQTAPLPTEPPAAPTIQEIVPPLEAKKLQEQAQARRREVQQILDQLSRRGRLSPTQRSRITDINSFLTASSKAEDRGDMKQADAMADRAQILARELLNEK